jgi:protein TonB
MMFRNSLIGSIILHVLFLIGVSFMLPNNAVSKEKKAPLYLELAAEPVGVNESVAGASNVPIQQIKGSPKQMRVAMGAKRTSLVVAKFPGSPLTKVVGTVEKSIAEPQSHHDQRPDEPVKTDVSPVIVKPQSTAPKEAQRPLINAPPLDQGLGESIKTESRPAVELKDPDSGPGAGRQAPLDAFVAQGAGGSVKTNSGPGSAAKNPGTGQVTGESIKMESGHGGDPENPGTGPASGRQSLVYAPRPLYPMQARRNNWEGVALLEIRIGPDGRVQKVSVVQSSGYPVLDRSAEKAILKWRYRPVPQNGVAIVSQMRVRVKFCLKDWEN